MTNSNQDKLPATNVENEQQLPLPVFTPPGQGEMITSSVTGNTYIIGESIGEGHFGVVFACSDTWGNELAAKVLKPRNQPYETIKQGAIDEFQKLLALRHPNITFVYEAFEYRHTFYIITERCFKPIRGLFEIKGYSGGTWTLPAARCLLQAVHFIHLNGFAHQDIHLGNVFYSIIKDEILPQSQENTALTFKLGDLGITKLIQNLDANNTFLADWMRPPEAIDSREYGPLDHRIDIYHCALLLLQVFMGKELSFTRDEILAGAPRVLARSLPAPFNFALEKALRRHVIYRTASALELWRDLNSSSQPAVPLENAP
jgi:eukaryotic-like serine/threonine-protein kinase